MSKKFYQKTLLFLLALASFFIIGSRFTVYADDPTPTPTPTPTSNDSAAISSLQNQIKEYQQKINDLQGQEKTLSLIQF